METEILNIEYLIEYVNANPLLEGKPPYSIFDKPFSHEKSGMYFELLKFLKFENYTKKGIAELKEILLFDKSLEQAKIKQWTQNYYDFFDEHLFLFGIDYLETVNKHKDGIYLGIVNEFVDKSPFLSIIKFWECMWILYNGEYHLDIEKRSPPDPVDSYYYRAPDPNEPKDLEKVLNYLALS